MPKHPPVNGVDSVWCPECKGLGFECPGEVDREACQLCHGVIRRCPAPACATCQGVTYIHKAKGEVPITHPDFGQEAPCPDCADGRQAHMTGLVAFGVPRTFTGWTLESWLARFPETTESQFKAYGYAEALANEPETFAKLNGGRRGLFLYGPYGTGKTGMLVGSLSLLISKGWRGKYKNYEDFEAAIKSSYDRKDSGFEPGLIESLACQQVLMIDDAGSRRVKDTTFRQRSAYRLFEGFRGYPDGILLLTSNLTLDGMKEEFGEAVLSRIAELCVMVDVQGPDIRMTEAPDTDTGE